MLESYGKFGFSRPDLNGKKLAKGMCLVKKARDREAEKDKNSSAFVLYHGRLVF